MAERPQPPPPSLRSSSPWKGDNAWLPGEGGKDERRSSLFDRIGLPRSTGSARVEAMKPTTNTRLLLT